MPSLRHRALWGLCLALTACPERQPIERGLQLVYRKPGPEPVRSAVDRRLAHLKLRANLSEDERTLTVRVSGGADLARLKAVLARAGKLEFCAEDGPIASAWCDAAWTAAVSVDRAGTTCALQAATRRELDRALADAGVPLAFGPSGPQVTAWALEGDCFTPRVVAAEVNAQPPSLSLEFDRAGGRQFAELTGRLVGRRLIIRLDGVVTAAPVVREPITGGKAMLTAGATDRAGLEELAASLVGGALPPLVLEHEGTWGPPSLGR